MTDDIVTQADGAGQPVRQEQGGPVVQRDTAIQAFAAIEGDKQRALVQARQAIAQTFRRDHDEIRVRVLRDCERPVFAALALYKKPVGGKTIVGFSISFARCIPRYFKNLDVTRRVTLDNAEERTVTIGVYDIEDNVSYSKDIVVPKTVERSTLKPGQDAIRMRINSQGRASYLVAATEDDLAVKQAAIESKTLRNLYLELLTDDLKEEARERIEKTVRDQAARDPDAERKRLVDAFASMGVTPSDLKAYLGHELDKIGPQQIVELRAIYSGIRDKETTWPDVMAEALAEAESRTTTKREAASTDKPKTLDDLTKRKDVAP